MPSLETFSGFQVTTVGQRLSYLVVSSLEGSTRFQPVASNIWSGRKKKPKKKNTKKIEERTVSVFIYFFFHRLIRLGSAPISFQRTSSVGVVDLVTLVDGWRPGSVQRGRLASDYTSNEIRCLRHAVIELLPNRLRSEIPINS